MLKKRMSLVLVLAFVCGCNTGVGTAPVLTDDTIAACEGINSLLYDTFAVQAQAARDQGATQDATTAAIAPTCELESDPVDDAEAYDACVTCLTAVLGDVYP